MGAGRPGVGPRPATVGPDDRRGRVPEVPSGCLDRTKGQIERERALWTMINQHLIPPDDDPVEAASTARAGGRAALDFGPARLSRRGVVLWSHDGKCFRVRRWAPDWRRRARSRVGCRGPGRRRRTRSSSSWSTTCGSTTAVSSTCSPRDRGSTAHRPPPRRRCARRPGRRCSRARTRGGRRS